MDLMTGGELFDRIVQLEKYTEADAVSVVPPLLAISVSVAGSTWVVGLTIILSSAFPRICLFSARLQTLGQFGSFPAKV